MRPHGVHDDGQPENLSDVEFQGVGGQWAATIILAGR
jgi:hypothetical protein